MARLIDADTLNADFIQSYTANADVYLAVRKIIEDAPTVDAVEVVRCKDCRMFVHNKEAFVTYCKRELKNLYVKENDYCSYGKRKVSE